MLGTGKTDYVTSASWSAKIPWSLAKKPMIELTNISKSYDSTCVLEPINLVIERGRTTVLIGPSGCGKSTLLRIMVGLETADSG